MTNEQLIELIEERLIAKGYTHPDDRDILFFEEVIGILGREEQ